MLSSPNVGSNSLCAVTASDFLELLRHGEVTVAEYATALADQIAAIEPDIHAWCWYERDQFIAAAQDIDKRIASHELDVARSSMPGVPVGVKDVFNTADMPTAFGSELFAGYQPGNDARVVTNIRRAGGFVQGKTVTAELGVHWPGKTKNPIDPTRSVGTSSSGSAAAVAAFMTPLALGSQTAASAVRPASYTGIMAFKPSFGLLPRTAMLKTTDTLDSVAALARSVADLRLIFEVMRVRGPNYPVIDREMSDPARLSIGNRPWRIGLIKGPKSPVEAPAVKEHFGALAARLPDLNCNVEPVRLPSVFDAAHEMHETIYRRTLAYYFKREWSQDEAKFSPVLASMIRAGFDISLDAYTHACEFQSKLAREYDDLAARYDVLLCPAAADEAPLSETTSITPDHTLIWTMCRAPTLTLPLLKGTSGLPVGLQIISRRFNDYIALDFAALLERSFAINA